MRTWMATCIAVLTATSAATGQTVTTCAAARTLGNGVHVELTGRIGNITDQTSSGTVKTIHIQDATGGIAIFGSNALVDAVTVGRTEGDQVTVRGVTGSFNGLFQLQDNTAGGQPLVRTAFVDLGAVAPTATTVAEMQNNSAVAEARESMLVSVSGVVFTATGTFAAGVNYTVTNGLQSFIMRIPNGNTGGQTDMIGQPIPTGICTITGILSQFDGANPAPGVPGSTYQLQPRRLADVLVTSPPGAPLGVASNSHALFTASSGSTCSVTLTATDINTNDTLTFTPLNPGTPGGGTLTPASIVVLPPGGTTRMATFTYNIPANFRGTDIIAYTVSDGTTSFPSRAAISVRGNAVQNSVLFGLNSGDALLSMRMYTGTSVPGGGNSASGARRDEVIGQAFLQSVEFDNYSGIRKNPAGNAFALNFGPSPNGPGSLSVLATQTGCTDPGPTTVATFNFALTGTGDGRPSGLSISPDNTKMAVWLNNRQELVILNYTPGAAMNVGKGGAAAVTSITLNKVVSLPSGNFNLGTEWLDNNNVLWVDQDGNLNVIDISVMSPSASLITFNPRGALTGTISASDITYDPAISPNIYVTIGEFTGAAGTPANTTFNTLYITDTTGAVIPQGSGMTMFTDFSEVETWREAAWDCFGNLFIGTFVDNTNRVNIKYIENARDAATIEGGASTLVSWHALDTDELTSNFSGLDIALNGAFCTNPPARANDSKHEVEGGAGVCTLQLTAYNLPVPNPVTFTILGGGVGSAGGTMSVSGAASHTGSGNWSQNVNYSPAGGFYGIETFSFSVSDGVNPADTGTVTINVISDLYTGIVAYGGNSTFEDGTMLLYKGAHTAGGGDAGSFERRIGQRFIQSTEFDNHGGVRHNPQGNLLGLDFGTLAGGGELVVYATRGACNGKLGASMYQFNGMGPAPLTRVSGLSVSPDNTKIAVYGVDTQFIYVLNYATGTGVGLGGVGPTMAGEITGITAINVSAEVGLDGGGALIREGLPTAWRDNNLLIWINNLGNVYEVDTAMSSYSLVRANPRPTLSVTSFSGGDIEYNPDVSTNAIITIGEFTTTTTNTLFAVRPAAAYAITTQSGGANFTDHTTSANTFRESAWDKDGNLFISTANDGTLRTNLELLTNAKVVSGITANSTANWNDLDVGQDTETFNGMDVSLGNIAAPVSCATCKGDMDGDNDVDGADVHCFVRCDILNAGYSPTAACTAATCGCADFDGDGDVDSVDAAAFLAKLTSDANVACP